MGVRKRHQTGLIVFIICIISLFVIYRLAVVQDSSVNRNITGDAGINPGIAQHSINSSLTNDIPVNSIQIIDGMIKTEETTEKLTEEIIEKIDVKENNGALIEQKASSNKANINDLSQNKPPAAKEEEQNPGDAVPRINESSEQIKLLRLFYTLLAEEQYDKAYSLLDDKFQLSAFKIIGAAEINKNDIDVYTFSEFLKALGVFRTLKIDSILAEKHEETDKEKICRIYYYQSLNMEDLDKVISPLVVILKKDNEWKIAALEDGIPGLAPF